MRKSIFLLLAAGFWGMVAPTPFQGQEAIPGELLVMFRPGQGPENLTLSDTDFRPVRQLSASLRIYLVAFDTLQLPPEVAIRRLYARKDVELVQKNHYLSPRKPAFSPNDTQFGQQWCHLNAGQAGGSPDADMDTDEAWDLSLGGVNLLGDTVVAAIVDGGFDLTHQELTFWKNRQEIPGNGLDDDQNGYIDDVDGWNAYQNSGNIPIDLHGTHVAGIASAKGNNGSGIAGVNFLTPVMAVAGATTQEATAVAAYGYVLAQRRRYNQTNGQEGAWVVAVNASFGVDFGQPSQFPIWCALYDSMGLEGILNIGATMNIGADVDVVSDIPSACPSDYLVTVTNTNRRDQRNPSAAFGLTTIDLGAPGTDILSTIPGGATGSLTGTSMATPQVTGILALMYAYACPDLAWRARTDPAGTALIMKQLLLHGVDTLPAFTGQLVSGGRANARGALREVDEWCVEFGGACLPPHGLILQSNADTAATITWIRPDGADSVIVRWRQLGNSAWNSSPAKDSLRIPGLLRCSEIEVSLASRCTSGDTSFFAFPWKFTTDGCCEPPQVVQSGIVTDQEVRFSWPVTSVDSVQITLLDQHGAVLDMLTTTDTTGGFVGLTPCTAYQASIRSFCDTLQSEKEVILKFNTPGCGLCQDPGYCSSVGVNANDEWIAGIQIGPVNRASGSDGGYADATFPPTNLLADTVYNFTLTPGFSGFSFQEKWSIWLDLNADTIFQDPEERLFVSNTGAALPSKGQIRLPVIADTLNARLRVSMKFAGFTGTPAAMPCDSFSFGEVEDYCVTLLPHLSPCLPPDGFSITRQPDSQTVRLTWKPYFKADSYLLSLRESGSLPWIYIPISQPAISITTLPSCRLFEWRVASVCGQDTTAFSDTLQAWSYGCGPCLDKSYCAASGGINSGSYIQSVNLGGAAFPSGNDQGYRAPKPDEGIVWYRNSPLSFAFQGASAGTWAGAYWRGWIDLNGDGDFLDAGEEAINSGLVAADSFAGSIPFPTTSDTLPSLIRLRVAMSRGGTPSACGTLADGEVEDYCIRINTPLELEIEKTRQISIFPNPASRSFELFAPDGFRQVALFDLQGKQYRQWTSDGQDTQTLPLPDLATGLYLLAITTGEGVFWQRLAINQE